MPLAMCSRGVAPVSGIASYNLSPSSIGSAPLFPAVIENNDQIGYHGTSSHYSNDIEANGFAQKKPISSSDIDLVISIGTRLLLDASGISGFKSLTSISFSPISELALYYAQPSSLGGQGLYFVTKAIDEILQNNSGNVTQNEMAHVLRIKNEISAIRSADPVVYAVDLGWVASIEYDVLTKGIKVWEGVAASKIVGKLIVPNNLNYGTIDTKAHKAKLDRIRWSSAPHFIKALIR